MPKQTEKKPAAAKYEWRKTEKAFYLPKEKGPVEIDVPEMNFFAVEGAGSPDSEEFQAVVGLLYTLSYTVRMMPKSGWTPPIIRSTRCSRWRASGGWTRMPGRAGRSTRRSSNTG